MPGIKSSRKDEKVANRSNISDENIRAFRDIIEDQLVRVSENAKQVGIRFGSYKEIIQMGPLLFEHRPEVKTGGGLSEAYSKVERLAPEATIFIL